MCRKLLANTVDLVMHGHEHKEVAINLNYPGEPPIIAAGSLYEGDSEDKWINSFHVLDLHLNEKGKALQCDVEFWGWSQNAHYWYLTGEYCEKARNGRVTWWPKREEKSGRADTGCDEKVRVAGTRPKCDDVFFEAEFKDRLDQCEDACRILADKTKKLICIFGHNGMGKTSLVSKVLRDIERNQLPETGKQVVVDGIVYLGRAEGMTFEKLFENCRQILASKSKQDELDAVWRSNQGIEKKIGKLLEALNDGQFIILIDGAEDLLDDQGTFSHEHEDLNLFFERALQISSGAKLLVTSSRELNINEVLRLRTHQRELSKGLPPQDAIARLRELDPEGNLGLKDAPDDQLTDIVRVTYGIPRALELVAHILSQVENRKITLNAIAKRFYEFDDVINGLVKETYRGLDPGSRRVVEALAIFHRPVSEEAVYYVLQTPEEEAFDIITKLTKTHLISWDKKLKAFSLHPIEQSYTYSQLSEQGDHLRKLHRLAADYYVKKRVPKEKWQGREDVDPQLFEFEQRIKAEDYDGAALLMDEIDYSRKNHHKYLAYLMAWGYGRESVKCRERLLGKLSPVCEVNNRTSLGWVCRRMGRTKEAMEHLRRAVELAQAIGDARAKIYAISELGYFLTDNAGMHAEAEECLQDALQIACSTGDRYSQAHILLGLAFSDFQRQRNSSSLENTSKALAGFQQVPIELARYREIDCWVRLGMIHRKTGDYLAAIRTAEEGLKIAGTHGLVDWKAELSSGLGFHHRAQGQYEAAVSDHKRALALFKEQRGMKREEAVQYSYLGNLYTDIGRFDEARVAYDKAESIALSIDLRRELSWIMSNKGVLYCRIGDYQEAYHLQQRGLQIVQENNHLDSQVVRFTDLAATLLAEGRYNEAEEALLNALQSAANDGKFKVPASLPEAYLESPYLEDKLPHEIQSPGDHQRRGALLTRIFLLTDRVETALQVIEATRRSHIENPHQHYLATLHALVLFVMKRFQDAEPIFRQAIECSERLLHRTPDFYSAYYHSGLAYAALALLTSDRLREEYLKRSADAYGKAVKICGASGVVHDARSLFKELTRFDKKGVLSQVEMCIC